MLAPRILLRGDVTHPDFATLLLKQPMPGVIVPPNSQQADVVLYLQPRAGFWDAQSIQQQLAEFPLAHHIEVVGSWAEGETRSGWPLHGVRRCYAYELWARLSIWLQSPPPARTASVSELCDAEAVARPGASGSDIFLASKLEHLGLAYAETLRSLGHRVRTGAGHSPDLWLLIGEDSYDGWTLSTARQLHAQWPECAGIAILNFPRVEETIALAEFGVTATLGQPCSVNALAACLNRSLPSYK